jgi:hypothetical protein
MRVRAPHGSLGVLALGHLNQASDLALVLSNEKYSYGRSQMMLMSQSPVERAAAEAFHRPRSRGATSSARPP